MKKVLFLNHLGSLGGAELTLLDIVRDRRWTATVVLFEGGRLERELQAAGVPVHVLPSRWAAGGVRGAAPRPTPRAIADVTTLAARVAHLARAHDLVYANSQKALIVASAAGLPARRRLLWAHHELLEPEHFSPSAIRLTVGLAKRFASRVVAHSNAIARSLTKWGFPAGRVTMVHYGIDPRPFAAVGEDEARAARQEWRLGASPLLGVFGRLTSWKGQHVVLEALARLPDVHALFVGAPSDDVGYAESLRRLAGTLRVAERAHFLGFRSDVPRLMKAVDVVVHSSVSAEPFGRVIVEAMLAAKPVVATNAGGVPEIVEHGATGLLVRPDSVDDLAAAVDELLRDPRRAAALGAAGSERARARFGLEGMLNGIDREIERVVSRPVRARDRA